MRLKALFCAALACLPAFSAMAETDTIRIARQWGLAWMPFVLMERERLIEKRAAAAGLGDVKVEWRTFSGGNVMNDALLSGNLDYATTGMPGFLILWDKARTALPVKAVSAFGAVPFALLTRDPNVKTLADFSPTNRIALPATKISGQAIILQMAAEKTFGPGNYAKLDDLTISRANPDGMAALVSGRGEIDSHFSSPPYQQMEMKTPGVHSIVSTRDIFDTPFSNGLLYTTQKFYAANPKVNAIVLEALKEAEERINADRRAAAAQYLEVTKEGQSVDQLVDALSEPLVEFSIVPHNVFAVATFMHRTGTIKTKPDSWKDLFFPDVHGLPGS